MSLRRIISTTLILVLNTILGYGQVQIEPACALSIEKYGVIGLPGSDFVWTVIGGTIVTGEGSDTISIKWDDSPGTIARIEVREYTSAGCFTVPSIASVVIRGPIVDLSSFEREICFGDTAQLYVDSLNFIEPYIIEWQDNSQQANYFAYKSEKIKVTVIDSAGCIDADSLNFTVNNLPIVNLGRDTILCDINNPLMIYYSQIMDNSLSFSRAIWNLSGAQTTNDYISIDPVEFLDTLSVLITDNNECSQSDTMLIIPCDVNSIFVNMPNTITPDDGNDDNNVWNITHVELFPTAVLEIFDRWGRLVYHTEHVFDEPWDGKSKGRLLPMDAYYFVLNLNFGNSKPIVGTVNLIK